MLVELLKDPEEKTRANAAGALGSIFIIFKLNLIMKKLIYFR